MSPAEPRYPDRVPRRYVGERRSAREARAARYRSSSQPLQSTSAVTAKVTALAAVIAIVIGILIAAQMATGSDPALGPKAVAQKKRNAGKSPASASSASNGTGAGGDPYSQSYGDGSYYYYGSPDSGSSGSSSGSTGSSSSSGPSGYSYSPPPVTSGTS